MKGKVRFGVLGAFVALAGAFGMVTSHKAADQVDAQIPAGLQVAKTCGATNITIGGTTTCTVTITATAAVSTAEPIVLTINNGQASGTGANPEYGRVVLLAGTSGAAGPDVDSVQVSNPTNGLGQTITVGCTGVTCDFAVNDTITITENIRGAVGGPTTESLRFGANVAVALNPTVTVGPAQVTYTVSCTGGTLPIGGIAVGSGAAGASTCTVNFDDNDLFPTVVSSANVTVTVTGPAGVVFSSTGTTTASFNCGAALNSPQSCDTISFGIQSNTGSTAVGAVSLQITYQPDIPAVDQPAIATTTGTVINVTAAPITVTPYRQPDTLRITCTSTSLGDPANGLPAIAAPTPTQIAALNYIAIGVLPGVVACRAEPIVNNAVVAVAPGTIIVTATFAAIVDGSGRVDTTINIPCDLISATITAIAPGGNIDPNTCTGVLFNVAGAGVGTAEIRARYLPSTAAVAAGIREVETRANIAFVAPLVTVSLLLNPNPINANGGTGVATARFNRTANCSFIYGQNISGGSACIDPTTGLPILFNFGSTLNGSVLYTIDNSAVAVWNEAVTPTPSSAPQTQGFLATANQVTRRCGFFPTAGLPSGLSYVPSNATTFAGTASGALAQFFGGCESTTATYRGVLPGTTNVTAQFIPDLPGAFGSAQGVSGNVAALLGTFYNLPGSFSQSTRVLEVVAAAPSGAVALARGCNNVSPTVSEAASAYAARVTPAAALVAIWEHQAATNTFRGFSPQAGAPNDLAAVTRLRPVFVCVSGAANLDQPAA